MLGGRRPPVGQSLGSPRRPTDSVTTRPATRAMETGMAQPGGRLIAGVTSPWAELCAQRPRCPTKNTTTSTSMARERTPSPLSMRSVRERRQRAMRPNHRVSYQTERSSRRRVWPAPVWTNERCSMIHSESEATRTSRFKVQGCVAKQTVQRARQFGPDSRRPEGEHTGHISGLPGAENGRPIGAARRREGRASCTEAR